MKEIELLAPAGSFEKAKIAFLYGADAVYCGTASLSLRSRAAIDDEDLIKTIKYAHELGKKVYVAMNIYAFDTDYEEIKQMCKKLEDAIENFSKAHREDLISEYTNELDVLKKLLPEPVNEPQICSAIEQWCIKENLIDDSYYPKIPKNRMGEAIKYIKEQYPQVDGKTISQLVKKCIR